MVKNVLSIIIATITGMICIVFMQMGIYSFFPPPPGTDLYDADSVEKAMKVMPQQVFVLFIASYVIASFIAGITATLISKRETKSPALISAGIMTVGGLINALSVHLPSWFLLACCFAYIPFAWLAWSALRKRNTRQ